MTIGGASSTTAKIPYVGLCVALCSSSTSLKTTTLTLFMGLKMNEKVLIAGLDDEFWPRCVVILVTVVPPSDWFWCGHPPLRPSLAVAS